MAGEAIIRKIKEEEQGEEYKYRKDFKLLTVQASLYMMVKTHAFRFESWVPWGGYFVSINHIRMSFKKAMVRMHSEVLFFSNFTSHHHFPYTRTLVLFFSDLLF